MWLNGVAERCGLSVVERCGCKVWMRGVNKRCPRDV